MEEVLTGPSTGFVGSGSGCSNSVTWPCRPTVGPIGTTQQSIEASHDSHLTGCVSRPEWWPCSPLEVATGGGSGEVVLQMSGRAYGSANATMIIAAAPNRRPFESDLLGELKLSVDSVDRGSEHLPERSVTFTPRFVSRPAFVNARAVPIEAVRTSRSPDSATSSTTAS